MKEYIDEALSRYLDFARRYHFIVRADELIFEWNPLIVCLYLSFPEEFKNKYENMNVLIKELEDFLLRYYAAPVPGMEDIYKITGYTYCAGSAVSCFSIHSLLMYSFMDNGAYRDMFYKIMIQYPFYYECDHRKANNTAELIQLGINIENLERGRRNEHPVCNGEKIKQKFNRFINKEHYSDNQVISILETTENERKITEIYFLIKEGVQDDE